VGQVTTGKNFETGGLKRKSVYGKTKREVSEKIVQIQNELNNRGFKDPTNATEPLKPHRKA